ncbi:MAG: alpha/beta hydrolase [Rhodovibrionaceae bacterium]
MESLSAAGRSLEYRLIPGEKPGRPTVVLLHEGLGSLALWKDFPQKVAVATGCAVLTYSRYGYGGSERLAESRGLDYMHREALDALPEVLAALKIEDPVLLGHSDGASIALIYAGGGKLPVPRGVVAMAPHVFVEDLSIASIAQAKQVYATTDLAKKLGRYHDDPDATFWGWNDIWLRPEFFHWNIEDVLPKIACPVMVIQGADDEYGTLKQVGAIEAQVSGRCESVILPDCKHSPHRDQEAATLDAIARFIEAL